MNERSDLFVDLDAIYAALKEQAYIIKDDIPNKLVDLVTRNFSIFTGHLGEFRYELEQGARGEMMSIDFPELGFRIRRHFDIPTWTWEWEWCGDKPSDETITLLILALR